MYHPSECCCVAASHLKVASPVSEYAEAYTDNTDMGIDERILLDSQYNMVEFAKKYFRGAQRQNGSVGYIMREIIISCSQLHS